VNAFVFIINTFKIKMIYQIKISLSNIKPEIWRRVYVDPETSLYYLHHIIQIVMGWENYHLYEFQLNRKRYGNRDLLEDGSVFDDRSTPLSYVLTEAKDSISYLYDFGDSWKHSLKLEKISEPAKVLSPKCIDGKLNTPPEDCGGVPGFYHFIEIMSNRKHPEFKSTRKWYGGDYNPEFIDLDAINADLENLEDYIKLYED
jgi:hypothetical protein